MNDEETRSLVEDLEAWVKLNSNAPVHLFDLSILISILRRYYHITELKGGKK